MKIIEIKKDDIFRILSQRVQRSVKNLRYEDFDHSLFFYESVHVLRNIEFFVDAVLNMTVSPGFAGQKFIPKMTEKIKAIREMANKRNPDLMIVVDGNINDKTIILYCNSISFIFFP